VVEAAGETEALPLAGVLQFPAGMLWVLLQEVALVIVQDKLELPPLVIEVGLAARVTAGQMRGATPPVLLVLKATSVPLPPALLTQ
jgi:hypothetical protein